MDDEVLKVVDSALKIGLGAVIGGVVSFLNNIHISSENKKKRKQELILKRDERIYEGYKDVFNLLTKIDDSVGLYYLDVYNCIGDIERGRIDSRQYSKIIEKHNTFVREKDNMISNLSAIMSLTCIENFGPLVSTLRYHIRKISELLVSKSLEDLIAYCESKSSEETSAFQEYKELWSNYTGSKVSLFNFITKSYNEYNNI